MGIVIRGDGIAARACARLLDAAEFEITREQTGRTPVPALMLSGRTQQLLCEVFGSEDLFHGFPRVEARIVQWSKGSAPLRFPHSAVVVAEEELLDRLKSATGQNSNRRLDWTVYASRPLPAPSAERRFGSRLATVLPVELARDSEASVCWIESLAGGWLFLLPGPHRKAWLLAVGDAADHLIAESRLVAAQIQSLGRPAGQFPAYPSIADPFCGPNWLACGSAALGFDPLCGDGAGNAVREAILLSAIIRAAVRGEPQAQLLDHYRNRLLHGFNRHLRLCHDFYAAACRGPWWDSELALIRQGLEYCERQRVTGPFRYRLQGLELNAV